ncbi:MAG TPA: saccharopine dehydrogenase [Pseudonocardiaceae bacterium]
MSDVAHLWIRHESRPTERRAPVVPADAAALVAAGLRVTVEESPQRVFPIEEYAAAGCAVTPAGSWVDAPRAAFVVGIKELPGEPAELAHRHVFFGHAFKGQPGAAALLGRFARGGGELLDVEYLVDASGRRLAAFGYWAGFVGAALAVLAFRGRLGGPLTPSTREELEARLHEPGREPASLVIGALGRSGRGAVDALAVAGAAATRWDVAETRALDRPALLAHELMVNTVLTTTPVPPFLTPADLDDGARRLTVVCDVTADVGSELNVLPVYSEATTWDDPVRRLREDPPFDLIAIDNLPSLLPREASTAFSAELTPWLGRLGTGAEPWERAAAVYREAAFAVPGTD